MNRILSKEALKHFSQRLKNEIEKDVLFPFILINKILSENHFQICSLKANFKV